MKPEETAVHTIIRELPADLETPVSLYLKLRGLGSSFLLESVVGGEHVGRYSYIGVQPRAEYILRSGQVDVKESGVVRVVPFDPHGDPTRFLQDELGRFSVQQPPNMPPFTGGLVGYLGFEAARYFEPALHGKMHTYAVPDGIFLLADTLIAFDNVRRSVFLIAHVLDGDTGAAESKLEQLRRCISGPLPAAKKAPSTPSPARSNLTRENFEAIVNSARQHIVAGDIQQVILSQRFTRQTDADPFDIYRAVRRLNPSPYMFFFDFGLVDGEPLYMVGTPPEMFVRLEGQTAFLRVIAGTRPRDPDPAADAALAEGLLADPKERAEHIMLVDLGRADLGRVCTAGTVRVPDFTTIKRFASVMHIASSIEGTLRPGLTAFDLLRAAFPAGSASGVPKARAVEIITALETDPRGAYSGMTGWIGFNGAMDTSLTIRTMIGRGSSVSVQVGTGIMADSDPASEYQETLHKAGVLLGALSFQK